MTDRLYGIAFTVLYMGDSMANAIKVGPTTDARNKRIIAATSRTFLGYGLHHDPQMLLEDGNDEGRADYAKRVLSRLKLLALLVCVAILVFAFMPKSERPVAPPPTFTDAGSVVSVQLHDTALSTSTSVATSQGTFQVRGAVTAAPGDVARIKKAVDYGTVEKTSLCIESQFKSACYLLM